MANDAKDLYRPATQNDNAQKSILVLTADKTEDLEFFYPYYRFIEAGFKVDVATPNGDAFKGKQGLGLKETKKIAEINSKNYVLLYIPGGKAPAELKSNMDALKIVREFAVSQKPIAAICHGPQLLAAAQVIDRRKIAAWPEVKDEVIEAGALYVNEETVADGQFITARWPGDLPAHLKRTLDILHQASQLTGAAEKRPAAA